MHIAIILYYFHESFIKSWAIEVYRNFSSDTSRFCRTVIFLCCTCNATWFKSESIFMSIYELYEWTPFVARTLWIWRWRSIELYSEIYVPIRNFRRVGGVQKILLRSSWGIPGYVFTGRLGSWVSRTDSGKRKWLLPPRYRPALLLN